MTGRLQNTRRCRMWMSTEVRRIWRNLDSEVVVILFTFSYALHTYDTVGELILKCTFLLYIGSMPCFGCKGITPGASVHDVTPT